uniref:Uncharacterized protein n=1 Tax=Arion vulgaris TaxID=1028688 RepID=A0A0B7B4V5_9EUPU
MVKKHQFISSNYQQYRQKVCLNQELLTASLIAKPTFYPFDNENARCQLMAII